MFGSAWVKTAVSINKSFSSKCNMHRFLFAFSAQNNMHYFRQFGFSSVLVQLNHFHCSRHHGNLKNNNACMDGAQKQKMNRMRRIARMGKAKVPSAVQKDKDESIVFFRELCKHEKDTDMNLLEPMYSVEFDAIQGGHMSKPPTGRRDFLVPIAEKHDYEWLKTPPAASLFPSLEVEANSSKTVLQELPIPRPVKPFASRFLGRPEGTKKASSPPGPPPMKNLTRGAPPVDKRSTHTALPSRQQKPAGVTARATTPTNRSTARAVTPTSSNSAKKQSDMFYATHDSSANATTEIVQSPEEVPYMAPKNLLTTGSAFPRRGALSTMVVRPRSRGPAFGADVKGESIGSRRPPPCPAARCFNEPQADSRKNVLPAKGKAVAGTGGEPAGEVVRPKGMRAADGKSERRRPRFADK